jgi:hypothetical protein
MQTTMLCASRPLLAALLAGLALNSPAHEGAHVHGQVRLDVAVDGPTLTLQMEAPLDSVLGFEHRARTPAERQAIAQMKAGLADTAALFKPDAAAQCTAGKADLQSALFEPAAEGAAAHGEEHMDLDASYEFTCQHPALLKTVQVGLFDRFKGIRRIDVQVAAAQGQRKLTLTRAQPLIRLAP